MADQPRDVAEEAGHLAAHHVGDGGGRAAVRHMGDGRAAGVHQLFDGQVRNAADARAAHRDGWLGLAGVGHELGRGARRIGRVHHQQLHVVGHQRDRRKVALHVVRQLLVQRRIDRRRAHAGDPDGAAIGRRAHHFAGADGAVGTALVVDDDGLVEFLAQLLAQRAGHEVDRPARRKGHDDAGALAALSQGRQRGGQHQAAGQRGQGRASVKGHVCLLSLIVNRSGRSCRRPPRVRCR